MPLMTFFKHQFYWGFFLSFFKPNLNRRAFRFVIMTVLYQKKYSGLFEQVSLLLFENLARNSLVCSTRVSLLSIYYRH